MSALIVHLDRLAKCSTSGHGRGSHSPQDVGIVKVIVSKALIGSAIERDSIEDVGRFETCKVPRGSEQSKMHCVG